jgi:hypothetical protein
METATTVFRARSSPRVGKFDWQFLAFWLTYFGVIFAFGYAIF